MAASGVVLAPPGSLNESAACFDYVRVYSSGFWQQPGESILQHSLFRFNVQLAMFFSVSFLFHYFLERYRVPKISSDILAGLVLGTTFFERFFPDPAGLVFNAIPQVVYSPNVVMASIAKIGFVFYGFLSGVRMEPSLILRMGRSTIILGVVLAIFPQLMTMCLNVKFPKGYPEMLVLIKTTAVDRYVSIMTYGQFMGVSDVLMQLRITNSKIGHLALASQLVTELLRFVVVLLNGFVDEWIYIKKITAIHSFLLCCIFTVILAFGLRPMIYYFIRATPEGQHVKKSYINLLLMIVLASASSSELVGVFYTYGPFLIGLLVPAGSPLARDVVSMIDSMVSWTLIPIMVTFCATKFDLVWFFTAPSLSFTITFIAYLLKLFVTFVSGLYFCELPARDAAALTLVLNYKGVLEIGSFLNYGNIEFKDAESTSAMLFVLIFATAIPPLTRFLYDPTKQYIGYEKKSVQFTAPDSELKILSCVHRQEDAMASIKLLGYTNPTKESSLSIYGLCLEELVASSTPVLINHQLNQKTDSLLGSRSQPSIDVFNYFQNQHSESTQVGVYTAMSPLVQMHEDICWLAFNKAVSLVILPFHKKWNSKTKKLNPGLKVLRTLNIDVLTRAPCSVAILIDRRDTQGLSSIFVQAANYLVGVLFIGGNDDREALAYATRMAGSFRVQLTVVRLNFGEEQNGWEHMLDTEAMRQTRQQASGRDNVSFREERIGDGTDIANIVHEMEDTCDLIIVGRRHETEPPALSELSQWTDLPELGQVGDMLASEDIKSSVSVLVVQQQVMKAENSFALNKSNVF